MQLYKHFCRLLLGFFLLFSLFGCFAKNAERHLSSDVCLLFPDKTTKQDVVRQLGSPDFQRQDETGETWIYFQTYKSPLRKLPWAGPHLGSEEYEVVSVTFADAQVRACIFRSMDRTEFMELGLSSEE